MTGTSSYVIDDGLVLIEGALWRPEDVTRACARKFARGDGRGCHASQGLIRRYSDCYPHPDLTTPTFAEFRASVVE